MTCGACQAKVQELLSKVSGVKIVTIDLTKGEAAIGMDKHIATNDLKEVLKDYPKYQLSEALHRQLIVAPIVADEERKSWIKIYKPILLIFGYVIGITLLVEYMQDKFAWMRWMNHFMAGFFLVFSFFKLLNLKGLRRVTACMILWQRNGTAGAMFMP